MWPNQHLAYMWHPPTPPSSEKTRKRFDNLLVFNKSVFTVIISNVSKNSVIFLSLYEYKYFISITWHTFQTISKDFTFLMSRAPLFDSDPYTCINIEHEYTLSGGNERVNHAVTTWLWSCWGYDARSLCLPRFLHKARLITKPEFKRDHLKDPKTRTIGVRWTNRF